MTCPRFIDKAFIAALRTFPGWELLTARELEVLETMVVHCESGRSAAARLVVAIGTVEAHWSHIMRKLGYDATRRRLHRDLLIAYGRALEREPAAEPSRIKAVAPSGVRRRLLAG